MTYTRRNMVEEHQQACQQAQHLIAMCAQFQITLDPIDWQQFAMHAPVRVNGVEIASLLELGQREGEDVLRQVRIKLLERAALETVQARPGLKASMWSPVDVMKPQAFLSLWIITLETGERIPILETIRHEQRVYEPFILHGNDENQLAALFGPVREGAYHLGDWVTIKEHGSQYTGKVIYAIPPGKALAGRKDTSRGYHTISGIAYTNDVTARYIVDCNDGFPHIVHQSQVIQ